MKELLELVLERYNKPSENYLGLCNVIADLILVSRIGYEEKEMFDDLLNDIKNNQKIFFNWAGRETEWSDQFLWPPYDRQSRIKWLKTQIKNHS